MSLIHNLWAIAGLIFVLNMPFGFWRAGVRRFSMPWFVAIHAPVVLAICIRMLAGVPLRTSTLLLFAGVFVLGQSLGGKLHARRVDGAGLPSSCGKS